MNEKIAVAGTGYVGLSLAVLLSQHNKVTAVDVIPEKVDMINSRKSPVQDEYIEKYLAEKSLDLTATTDGAAAYRDAAFVVIAAPTNYDPVKNYFDTSHVEEVIDLVLSVNPDAVMVIKSTIPVGYCRSLYVKYADRFRDGDFAGRKLNLLFSPEFLRERDDFRYRTGECGHRRGRRSGPHGICGEIRRTAEGRCPGGRYPDLVHGPEGG